MPTVKLTPSFVRSLRGTTGDRKVDYFDTEQRGFMLEVRPSGGKTYYQRYTDGHGRERQFKIGPADVLTLDQARRKALSVLKQAIIGTDPQDTVRFDGTRAGTAALTGGPGGNFHEVDGFSIADDTLQLEVDFGGFNAISQTNNVAVAAGNALQEFDYTAGGNNNLSAASFNYIKNISPVNTAGDTAQQAYAESFGGAGPGVQVAVNGQTVLYSYYDLTNQQMVLGTAFSAGNVIDSADTFSVGALVKISLADYLALDNITFV